MLMPTIPWTIQKNFNSLHALLYDIKKWIISENLHASAELQQRAQPWPSRNLKHTHTPNSLHSTARKLHTPSIHQLLYTYTYTVLYVSQQCPIIYNPKSENGGTVWKCKKIIIIWLLLKYTHDLPEIFQVLSASFHSLIKMYLCISDLQHMRLLTKLVVRRLPVDRLQMKWHWAKQPTLPTVLWVLWLGLPTVPGTYTLTAAH